LRLPENPPTRVKSDHAEVRNETEAPFWERESMERLNLVKEYFILGTDKLDAEKQRDLWLSQNPAVKVIKSIV